MPHSYFILRVQQLAELIDYSANFDIRPRRRYIIVNLSLATIAFILGCIAEDMKYSKLTKVAPKSTDAD